MTDEDAIKVGGLEEAIKAGFATIGFEVGSGRQPDMPAIIAEKVRAWAQHNAFECVDWEDTLVPGPNVSFDAVPVDQFGHFLDAGLAEAKRGEVKDLDWSVFPEGDG